MVRRWARLVHPWLAWVFVGTVLLQVFLAGLALFAGAGFEAHREAGYTYPGIAALAVLIAAIVGGAGRREIGLAFLLLVLYVVQTILPALRADLPVVAALHPVNAVALFTLGAVIAVRARRLTIATPPSEGELAAAQAGQGF
jgi:hypothetical protein